MGPVYRAPMTRLTPLTRDQLDETGAAIWDGLVESRGGAFGLTGPDGALVGPFNAFVHAPDLGRRLSSLGAHLRFGTSIDRRLTEVAICTVGAHWHAEFEFWAHAPMATEHGVAEHVIDALRAGTRPDFERDDERIVYDIVSQSLTNHRVDEATYVEGRELLGEQGLVELVSISGYYCLISLLLNLFDVALPDDAERAWPDLA
ncbi:MAG: 4-carboxymuconolactone decarboxylase [Acidimicrobiaceae bacterium]|nr:4-carboxymuconolactone decarboxylase [Acidimicrobiaceae bacterium]